MSNLYELTQQQLELKAKLLTMGLDQETIADTIARQEIDIG